MKYIKSKYTQMSVLEKQKSIKLIKDKFEKELIKKLGIVRVSAPLIVTKESGLQDDLSGVERKVSFDVLKDGAEVEIVQSLAKWKRFALKKYDIPVHRGLYADMSAIRRDDKMDEIHSIFVDQWDWEKVILPQDRTIGYLKHTVCKIVKAISDTSKYLVKKGCSDIVIGDSVYFITSQELLDMYPSLTPKEREYMITKQHKTVFIIGIGDKLSDGAPHDLRAPDYDDWSMDGDLFVYHEVLDIALEISSMGVRVDGDALVRQLRDTGCMEKMQYMYHKMVADKKLPLSIGGGIGQSRLCMLLLGRAHIGEVQASYWDAKTMEECKKQGIELL